MRKMKLTEIFQELTNLRQHYNFDHSRENAFGQNKSNEKLFDFRLNELILEESPYSEQQMQESNKTIESINKYTEIITEKLRVANKVWVL